MMTLDKRFVRDLGKILTVLNEHFFLDSLQVTIEEKTTTYGGDRKYVDSYTLEFHYRDRDIKLETFGDGLVHTQVEGKEKYGEVFDFDTGDESKNEENIRMFSTYAQTDLLKKDL